MTREQVETYYNTFGRFKREEISYSYWMDFCAIMLEEIMEENRDVLIRLKEGG